MEFVHPDDKGTDFEIKMEYREKGQKDGRGRKGERQENRWEREHISELDARDMYICIPILQAVTSHTCSGEPTSNTLRFNFTCSIRPG